MVLKQILNIFYCWCVWEWCKNVWYSNQPIHSHLIQAVWEWCKNVWYSNDGKAVDAETGFENDVKMYGTQTMATRIILCTAVWEWCKNVWYSNLFSLILPQPPFENDVKMYGTQTIKVKDSINLEFENDVKMYGTQTQNSREF